MTHLEVLKFKKVRITEDESWDFKTKKKTDFKKGNINPAKARHIFGNNELSCTVKQPYFEIFYIKNEVMLVCYFYTHQTNSYLQCIPSIGIGLHCVTLTTLK